MCMCVIIGDDNVVDTHTHTDSHTHLDNEIRSAWQNFVNAYARAFGKLDFLSVEYKV